MLTGRCPSCQQLLRTRWDRSCGCLWYRSCEEPIEQQYLVELGLPEGLAVQPRECSARATEVTGNPTRRRFICPGFEGSPWRDRPTPGGPEPVYRHHHDEQIIRWRHAIHRSRIISWYAHDFGAFYREEGRDAPITPDALPIPYPKGVDSEEDRAEFRDEFFTGGVSPAPLAWVGRSSAKNLSGDW